MAKRRGICRRKRLSVFWSEWRYHTSTTNKDIHFFSCSNYEKDYRGTCKTRHYIRADALYTIVTMELRRLAEYLKNDEDRFAEILARKSDKDYQTAQKQTTGELTKATKRLELRPVPLQLPDET